MGDEAGRKEEAEERKRGRPTNAERLGRGRAGSEGNIAEFLANKRKAYEVVGKDEEREVGQEGDPFKRSKLVGRSPEKKGGTEELMRLLTEKLEGVVLREVGRVEKRVEEMTRGCEMRLEEMAKEARREREELIRRWEGEREAMKGRIAELEERVGRIEVGSKESVGEGGQGTRVGEEKAEGVERKLREVELRMDRCERERRKKNVVVKEVRRGWTGREK